MKDTRIYITKKYYKKGKTNVIKNIQVFVKFIICQIYYEDINKFAYRNKREKNWREISKYIRFVFQLAKFTEIPIKFYTASPEMKLSKRSLFPPVINVSRVPLNLYS